MRVAIADPPYPGQALKHYGDHPDFAGEVDHAALIEQLAGFDAWALHTSVPALRDLLPLIPERHRIGAWVKSFASWKRNVWPAHAWEPVILVGGRNRYGEEQTPADFILEPITLERGVAGAKPERVMHWVFDCLGLVAADELVDLFPGSGAVTAAWSSFAGAPRIAFPADPETAPLF